MIKNIVFGIALAAAGVAVLAGSAMAQRITGHGSHGGNSGAGPRPWPTSTGCPTVVGNPNVVPYC